MVCSNPPGMPTWGQGQAGSIRNWLAPLSAVVRMDRVNSEPIKHTKPCGVAAPPLIQGPAAPSLAVWLHDARRRLPLCTLWESRLRRQHMLRA